MGIRIASTVRRNRRATVARRAALLLSFWLCATAAPAQSVRVQSVSPVPSPTPVPTSGVTGLNRFQELARQHPACIAIGEGVARLFVSGETLDEGPIEDCVLGAKVTGTQQTRVSHGIDFLSGSETARLMIVLNGVTNNQTLSQVSQAMIRSEGSYQFHLTKQTEFDGLQFRTWSPAAFLTIHQRHLGAMTPVSRVPLLGPLANATVLNAAEQRRPVSERIAAQRVTEQVAPRFNAEFDGQLAELNRQLHELREGTLKSWNLIPTSTHASTMDDVLFLGLAFANERLNVPVLRPSEVLPHLPELPPIDRPRLEPLEVIPQAGNGTAPVRPVSATQRSAYRLPTNAVDLGGQITIAVHESLVRQLSSRFALEGKEVPDSALKNLPDLQNLQDPNLKPEMAVLIFDDEHPLSTKMENGEIILEVRVAIQPVLGPAIPTQVVRVALRVTLMGDQVLLHPEYRSMHPLEPGDSPLMQAAEAIVRQSIQSKLQDSTLPATFTIPKGTAGETLPMRLQSLNIEGGWLTAVLTPVVAAPAPVFPQANR